MVERLKTAIQKAEAQRNLSQGAQPASPRTTERAVLNPSQSENAERTAVWNSLKEVTLAPDVLENNRIVSHSKNEPAYIAFDVLRTRILTAFQKNGWSRIGISSPTKNAGKTFVSINLALSMTRGQQLRTVLMDMDLRLSSVGKTLGIKNVDSARWFLSGDILPDEFFHRVGPNLALGLNERRIRDSAELILDQSTGDALARMRRMLQPDVEIYDLPPLLACDDVMGFLPQVDCILLVIGGGMTRTEEIVECERVLKDQTQLLGVLLNKAEDPDPTQYGYGYGYGYGYY